MEHLWAFLIAVAAIMVGLTIGGMVKAGSLLSSTTVVASS